MSVNLDNLTTLNWEKQGNLEVVELDGKRFFRKPGNPNIYEGEEENLVCIRCGSKVEEANVSYPLSNNSLYLQSGGKCRFEKVPYCPTCEQKPAFIKRSL